MKVYLAEYYLSGQWGWFENEFHIVFAETRADAVDKVLQQVKTVVNDPKHWNIVELSPENDVHYITDKHS